jgi:hypothetical protein
MIWMRVVVERATKADNLSDFAPRTGMRSPPMKTAECTMLPAGELKLESGLRQTSLNLIQSIGVETVSR